MTSEELRAMDAEVAAKVFGWCETARKALHSLNPETRAAADALLPYYSTDLAAAWQVAEWLREDWGQFFLDGGLEWHCYSTESNEPRAPEGSGETPMLAICRAALATAAKRRAHA